MVLIAIALVAGVGAGVVAAVIVGRYASRRTLAVAEERAARTVAAAQSEKDERIEQARADAAAIREQAEQELQERESALEEATRYLASRNEDVERKVRTVNQLQNRVANLKNEIKAGRAALREIDLEMTAQLAEIAGTTPEEAGQELLQTIEQGLAQEAQVRVREIESEAKETADEEARRVLGDAIQRLTVPAISAPSSSTIPLSERELARTISMSAVLDELSERTNTSLTLDEENASMRVSAADAVNRELAKVVFAELLRNGRNRGHLGQLIDRHSSQLDQAIRKAGAAAVRDAGCQHLPRPVMATLGRLKFRYSYGQNQLIHAVETAHLAAILARELGADVEIARAGGLLHDLGKAIDREVEGTHAALGAQLALDAGIDPRISHCIEAHHEEIDPATTEALITIIADAASGGRPGARRESLENYLARLEALESVGQLFPGVDKCYAISAGRELRVIVDPQLVGDDGAARIASAIGQRIQETLEYPGQIKVTVIRESRTVEHTH